MDIVDGADRRASAQAKKCRKYKDPVHEVSNVGPCLLSFFNARSAVPQLSNTQWSFAFVLTFLLLVAWPPSGQRSLAVKFVRWAADPGNQLPTLPGPLPMSVEDDPQAVLMHASDTWAYDALYAKGGWTRVRLELKVAEDPFDPATERQVLTVCGVLAALAIWRAAGQKR